MGRRELSLLVFFSLVCVICNMDMNMFHVWLIKLILSIYLFRMLCLDDYFVYLSISYIYEMKCVVVPFYPCYINVILCMFTICHTILSHDFTHPFRHPIFYKIIHLSSHMPLSVIFAIINSYIYLGGPPCTNLKNKTLLCLIVKKL
jgi:hypothetical protein